MNAPKINWVQKLLVREEEGRFSSFRKIKLERAKSENDSYCYSCLSLVLYIRIVSSFSLELKKANWKKNFNFLLSTWCCYWMWVCNAFEDVFIHSTLSLSVHKKEAWVRSVRGWKIEILKMAQNWNGISMIKTLSKFNFLLHHFQHSATLNIHDMTRFTVRMLILSWWFDKNLFRKVFKLLSGDLKFFTEVIFSSLF